MKSSNALNLFFASLIMASGIWGCTDETDYKEIIYVGTFNTRGSEGLYVYEFDRDELSFTPIQIISDRTGPNFQTIHPNGQYLYSVSSDAFSEDNRDGTVSAYRINQETGELTLINEQSVEGRGPCHVSVDPHGEFAYVSNYGSGNLTVHRINADGGLSEAVDVVQHEGGSINEQRQNQPRMHSIIPSADGRFIYASDLGIDKVMIYEVDRGTGKLSPAPTPYVENVPGSGPRHFTFHPSGDFAYSAEELSHTVAVFSVDKSTGALEQIQRVNMVPDDFEGRNSAADIHTSPDGRFLYASNRGHESLVIYEIDASTGLLTLVGHEHTRGEHPRNFSVDPNGEFVMVANMNRDNVVLFRRNNDTGEMTFAGTEVHIPAAVCVTPLFLPM
ncbi:MAG: lactonase family protein [Balneolales bacterium]